MTLQSDGSIRIETRIDNSKAKKDLAELNNLANDSANEVSDDMSNSIDKLNANWQKLEAQQDKNNKRIEDYKSKLDEISGINIANPKTEADFGFNNSINTEIEELNIKLKESEAITNLIDTKFSQIGIQAKKITNEIEISNEQTKSFSSNISDVSNGIGTSLTKIGKFALAMVGIRTAWQSIKSLGNLWLNSDSEDAKQTKADLDYIKGVLANSIAPLIQWIVKLFGSLLQVINSITQSLFGFSIFSKASSDYLKNASKSAKEIKKSLAGFDEANVLNSNKSSSSSEDNNITPSFDLSDTNKFFDGLLKKAKDVYKTIDNFWTWDNILNMDLGWAGNWETAILGFLITFKGVWDVIKGVYDILIGFGDILVGIFTGDFNLIKKGFDRLISGFVKIIYGLLEIVLGIAVLIIGIVTGAFGDIFGGATWLAEQLLKIILDIWLGIVDGLGGVGNWFKDRFNEAFTNVKNAFSSAKSFFGGVWSGIKDAFSGISNWFGDTFNKAWQKVKDVFSTGGQIFNGIKEGLENTFKTVINALISGVNVIVAKPFEVVNGMLNKIRNVSFLGISPFKGLWNENPLPVPRIPKLALGGIVSRPTQAIIGEAGPERVIPLSEDAEWIDKLANRIVELNGSNSGDIYIVLDGEIIERKTQERRDKRKFATNGGAL